MPRRPSHFPRDAEGLIRALLDLLARGTKRGGAGRPRLPSDPRALGAVLLVGLIVLGVAWLIDRANRRPRIIAGSDAPRSADGSLFVSWNVENFFDDRDDPANHDADEDWFGTDPSAFARKVDALRDAVLLYNDGHGPDILAMVEVESLRCVEALRDALNARLTAAWRYSGIVQRDDRTGRRFAPAILTRLAIREDLTRGPSDFGNRRILEAHLESEGRPLVILEAHWTSRLRGDETVEKRSRYAEAMYGRYLALRRSEPGLDVILAGDFNDEPDDPSLTDSLHAVTDPALVREADAEPDLLDLVTTPSLRGEGTYYLNGRWEFLDHILAPPELLDDRGWSLRRDTLEIGNFPDLRQGRTGRPRKFGGPNSGVARGYSDHFALAVRLRIEPAQSR